MEEYPTFDAEGGGGMVQSFELEEDVEVELNDIEPAFLRGQVGCGPASLDVLS